MKKSEIIHNLLYDEFGKKDYGGIIMFFVFMSPAIILFIVIVILLA